jgi:taurine--2-oxoglutarate transaminase
MAVVEVDPGAGERVRELDRAHLIHSWSIQSKLSPLPIAGGEGCYFWDYEGKRYLDFASQLVNLNLGHQHPKLVQAIKDQADRLCTIGPPMANDVRSQLAAMIAEVAPGDLNHVFFTNGGAEANENAIKLARWFTDRHKIVVRYRAYHGATAGAITLTGDPRRWYAEPGLPGVVRMFDPYTYRCSAGHPDPCPVCTGGPHLEEILMYEGPQNVAAVMMETVTGTNGVIVPPPGYMKAIRDVCDKHGILLVLDEVMAGFGRAGKWFACEHWDVVPDILTFAKGVNSGYVPLGGMIVSDKVFDWLKDSFFAGGLTYSGHPLACAAGVASIEAFREEGIVENAAAMGEVLRQELPKLQERHPSIGEFRGVGLFWMLELVRDRETREMLVPYAASGEAALPMARVTKAALEKGLYLFTHFNRIGITPPLVISRDELLEGLAILDEVLDIADEYTTGR